MINGVDANSMGTNSAPSLAVPAPESLQEFKVQTSLYDASFGRSGGGNIQAITKSGSNQFHGDVRSERFLGGAGPVQFEPLRQAGSRTGRSAGS
jgi:hypothetical protein